MSEQSRIVKCPAGSEYRPAALLTVKQAARLLAIDGKTLYKYVADGIVPYVRFRSNIRFRENELLDWIEGFFIDPEPPFLVLNRLMDTTQVPIHSGKCVISFA